MSLRRLLGEPLLHFLLLGALLFALYGALNRGALNSPDEIVVEPQPHREPVGPVSAVLASGADGR